MNNALQTFYFDHRFEALVGCACSRIVGETMARSEDKGKERGGKILCEDWTRKQRKSLRKSPEKTEIYLVVADNLMKPDFNFCCAA
jgi:hypothetical protein